jgi:hypothetical protein
MIISVVQYAHVLIVMQEGWTAFQYSMPYHHLYVNHYERLFRGG